MPDADPAPQYLFIVARDRSEILARARERFDGDPRIEVIADRRVGDRRRRPTSPAAPERRSSDRRRRATLWIDLSVRPMVVVQKHVPSVSELRARVESLSRECQSLHAENRRLREETLAFRRRLEALAAANAAVRAELAAALKEAERVLTTVRTARCPWPPETMNDNGDMS